MRPPHHPYRRPASWLLLSLVAAGSLTAAVPVADTSESPYAKLRPVGIDEVTWTGGFWKDRLATCHASSLPAMWDLMKTGRYKPFLGHFLIAAGSAAGDYHGAPWNDGDFYKFLEAVISLDPRHQEADSTAILAESIAAIAAAQRQDGYLHTPILVRQRNGDTSARPFTDRHDFEMYNMGHLLTTACLHYRATGNKDFLRVARKTADFLYDTFHAPDEELARNSVCPAHYLGVIELYRVTRDPRYLELAGIFLRMRDLVAAAGDGGDDNQDRLPFTQQREIAGHAVRANYLCAGATDLFLETGDPEIWQTLVTLWDSLVEKKIYLTGGCGALYDGASPDGAEDQSQITRVHQAYGRNYQLPNITAHSETCATVGAILWSWRMLLASGDPRYGDLLETCYYNALLAGVSLQGAQYFYVNPLRNVDPLPTPLRWSRRRLPFVTSYCCPPNLLRTVAQVGGYAFAKDEDTIYVNLYGQAELATTLRQEPLQLSQTSDYPWDGQVDIRIIVPPARPCGLALRIPGWAEQARITLNGQQVDPPPLPSTYVVVRRVWQAGDRLQLQLPMPPQRIEAHPLVEETVGQIAFRRGPIVYCLEALDLPPDVRIEELVFDLAEPIRCQHEPDLLGGVTTLQTTAALVPGRSWQRTLYRPVQPKSGDESSKSSPRQLDVRLIPYYAWANRGDSQMSVWLKAGKTSSDH